MPQLWSTSPVRQAPISAVRRHQIIQFHSTPQAVQRVETKSTTRPLHLTTGDQIMIHFHNPPVTPPEITAKGRGKVCQGCIRSRCRRWMWWWRRGVCPPWCWGCSRSSCSRGHWSWPARPPCSACTARRQNSCWLLRGRRRRKCWCLLRDTRTVVSIKFSKHDNTSIFWRLL